MNKRLLRLSKIRSRQGLYEFLNAQFQQIKSESNVLTIGSGGEVNKLLESYAKSKSFSVKSFDIDPERNPDVLGDLCIYDFGHQKYDIVIIAEVLEHLYAPQLGIDNIFKILNSGGKLILTTPFILPLHDRPYDYFRFTKYGLAYLLRNFEKIEIRERNSYFEAIDVLWVRTMQIGTKRAKKVAAIIIPLIFYLKRPFTKLCDRILKTDAMTTGYVVTAEKPVD